jgi:predicted NBD/HSP70 family sugar kinase
MKDFTAIGVDIGGIHISALLLTEYGEIVERIPPCQDELVPALFETLCTRGAGNDGTPWRPNLTA